MFELKSFVVCIFLAVTVSALHAEAPELKNVMPNSWRKVTRLSASEEQAFIRENNTIFAEIKKSMDGDDLGWRDDSVFDSYLIYKQQAGIDVFYRVLCTNTDNPDFFSPVIRFTQFLVYKNAIILDKRSYNGTSVGRNAYAVYNSIVIIEEEGKAKGVLLSGVSVLIIHPRRWSQDAYRKGQLFGHTGSHYFLMPEINRMVQGEKGEGIIIYTSDCLVDPNIPLRYGFQNAFDYDPATSYVENTENDLIEMEFSGIYQVGYISRIAIINGYAQNRDLYMNNNRVKMVQRGYGEVMIADNCLSYQFIDTLGEAQWVVIKDIYKGNRYNDTCIAELNVKTIHGWLFGDIDE